jgi:hypothetical protein
MLITKWDMFYIKGRATYRFAPVVLVGSVEIHASNRLYCPLCNNWTAASTSVGHYKEHVDRDADKAEQANLLSDPHGAGYNLLSWIIKRGEPMSALEWFRTCPEFANVLPSDNQFIAIVHAVKDHLEAEMFQCCATARFLSLAIDGWTDRRGRRYTGIGVRSCNPDTGSVGSLILAFKVVTEIHDSGIELRKLTDRVLVQYGIPAKIVNVCTDRAKMNEKAFRTHCSTIVEFLGSPYRWLPCTCHFLNNLLQGFMDSIEERKKAIFRIQQRFRKKGPFLAFLAQNDIDASIPGVSPVRWYSTHELFHRLLELWDAMEAFAQAEHKTVPELNPIVHHDLELMEALTGVFVAAQKDLESNDFAAGSHFMPHFLTIVDAIDQFVDLEESAVAAAHAYIDEFQRDYAVEWEVLTCMTFLNPSAQWVVGRTCSSDQMAHIEEALGCLVEQRIIEEGATPLPRVGPRDFHSYIATAPVESLAPADQVERYFKRRTSGSPESMGYWLRPHPELTHLAHVAIDFLALLATSASMERGFSVARHAASEWQMAILPENFSTRVLIQANWDKAGASLLAVLRMGRVQWKAMEDARKQKKAQQDNHWRLHLVPGPRRAASAPVPSQETMDDSSDSEERPGPGW